ncbi:MAG TPA: hypothetical protein VM118_10985, partial [Acidobacteriota bacterium]|nr:hypothetical protein [Acidobacteriota bacterium]
MRRTVSAIVTFIVLVGVMNGCGGDKGKGPVEIDGWQVVFGEAPNESASDVLQARDGNYVVLGSKQWFGGGSFDAYLLKID